MWNSRMLSAATGVVVLFGAACSEDGATTLDIDLDRDLVYVTDEAAGVHVFDATTLARVGEITVGAEPGEVHATPDGSLVWVLNGSSNTVSLLDTRASAMTTVDVGVSPVHSYIAPDYGTIWVGNDGSADVTVIDLATRSALGTVLTGAGHHKMAIATDDAGELAFAYVSNITDGSITPVSAARAPQANVPGVGAAPHGMDFAASTSYVYNCSGDIDAATDGNQPGIEVIATRDDPVTAENEQHTIVERIPLPDGRCGYLHVESAEAAFFTIGSAGMIGRLSLPGHVVETFAVGGKPDKFAIVGDRAYLPDVYDPIVTVVDLTRTAANGTIATGQPVDPANPPERGHRSVRHFGGRIYVPNGHDGTVTVIDVGNDSVAGTLEGMTHPVNVAVAGPGGGSTYPR